MRNLAILILLIFSYSFLYSQYSLSGIVSTQYNTRLISGAQVSLKGTSYVTYTDKDGYFAFANLTPSDYILQISYSSYSLYEQQISLTGSLELTVEIIPEMNTAGEVLISATRASKRTSTTYEELNVKEIEERNYTRDIPFLIEQTPSVVATSDAGAGVGYTGLRIRGSDPTRINVTVNGIPLNDSESHGVFWVNLPDLASSLNNIQVQRGVGTSTNGAAAFGASINLQTDLPNIEPFATSDNTYGSFNTWRNNIHVGSGLIKEKFSFDLRLSRIDSDGWVDRATSNLKSFFIGANYFGEKSMLKINAFTGKERTYQSWWGVPEAIINGSKEELEEHINRNFYTEDQIENLRSSGRQYNFYTYDNQVDDYQQDHYQLHYSYIPSTQFDLSLALHYTRGRGFFEEFREGDPLSAYGISPIAIGSETIDNSDLARRRWLDNHFYGFVFTTRFKALKNVELLWGGGANRYDGDHFGEVIWARFAGNSELGDRYYESRSLKYDSHSYVKGFFTLGRKLSAYADLQLRHIDYKFGDQNLNEAGTENEGRMIFGDASYTFFNPKVGVTYQINPRQYAYASFSMAHREPIRSDFIENPLVPEAERLNDLELGYRINVPKLNFGTTVFFMDYRDQLVLTGELNDVGAFIRTNVPDSYRAGIELQATWKPSKWLSFAGNITYSENKIDRFTKIITNFDNGIAAAEEFRDSDISFSPSWISGQTLTISPIRSLEMSLIGKYVSRQFMDNTSDDNRSIDAYYINDLRIEYTISPSWLSSIKLGVFINNLLDIAYEANGYTFGFIAGEQEVIENFYYPQAGINASGRIVLTF